MLSRGGATALFNGPTDGDVWKMRADASELTNLTPDSPATDDGYPSFSGDGAPDRFQARLARPLRPLSDEARRLRRPQADRQRGQLLGPRVLADGKRIAFLSNGDDPVVRSVRRLLDGARRRLRRPLHPPGHGDRPGQEGHVTFSHDGEWLVFTSEQGGISYETPLFPQPQAYGEIYAYRIADGTTVRLTHDWWEDGAPAWEKASVLDEAAQHARPIRFAARENLERRGGLVDRHSAAVECPAPASTRGAQQLGLEREIDDVGHPVPRRQSSTCRTAACGFAAMPIGVALTMPSARSTTSNGSSIAAARCGAERLPAACRRTPLLVHGPDRKRTMSRRRARAALAPWPPRRRPRRAAARSRAPRSASRRACSRRTR